MCVISLSSACRTLVLLWRAMSISFLCDCVSPLSRSSVFSASRGDARSARTTLARLAPTLSGASMVATRNRSSPTTSARTPANSTAHLSNICFIATTLQRICFVATTLQRSQLVVARCTTRITLASGRRAQRMSYARPRALNVYAQDATCALNVYGEDATLPTRRAAFLRGAVQ